MKPFMIWLILGVSWPAVLTELCSEELRELSDEFDDAASLAQWQRVYQAEGWGFDQLERWDVDATRPGHMFMMPHSSSWYAEWRGVHAYKPVNGDFVATTDVTPTRRGGGGPPNSSYSLAGILVRRPRPDVTGPGTWTPDGENYIFLSLGSASAPGSYQFEVKTTRDSTSVLEVSGAAAGQARIQIARIGPYFLALRQFEGGSWEVHRRYARPDLPSSLHVGLTTYTDWDTCSLVGYSFHNNYLLTNGLALPGGGTLMTRPDLEASFDYLRLVRPEVPLPLVGRNFADANQVSDAELLSFLGDHANLPGGSRVPARVTSATKNDAAGFALTLLVETNRAYRVQWTPQLPAVEWTTLTNFVSDTNHMTIIDTTVAEDAARYYRIISP